MAVGLGLGCVSLRRLVVVSALIALWPATILAGDDTSVTNDFDEAEFAFTNYTTTVRMEAVRRLKRVERRSKKLGFRLNRGKMEKLKGDRLFMVLEAFDNFVGVVEELPADFVRASRIGSVWFSDEIVDMDGNMAGGVASGDGIELPMHTAPGVIYHEMFHKFEANITAKERKEWEDLNPKEFIYTGSKWGAFGDSKDKKARERRAKRLAAGKEKTAAELREKEMSKKDKARIAANNTNPEIQAAFINTYGQTTPAEDRAEVFRCMVEEGEKFRWRVERSEYMRKKMEWMFRVTGKDDFLGRDFWHERFRSSDGGCPEDQGYDSKKLRLVERAIENYSLGVGAMVVSVEGRKIFEYGETDKAADISLCWVSLMSMVYGKYVHAGMVNLDETVEANGIDDIGGLERRERSAKVRHLLSFSSGCYHPSSVDLPDGLGARARGSVLPGSVFVPNNWDCAVAAEILERKTGKELPVLFEAEIAKPIGLKDWRRSGQRKTGDIYKSRYTQWALSLSARDLCAVGDLMCNQGRCKGLQILPEVWVDESTRSIIDVSSGKGYGYGWWVDKRDSELAELEGSFSARGLRGERITVIPKLKMTVAVLPAFDGKTAVKGANYRKLLSLILAARRSR